MRAGRAAGGGLAGVCGRRRAVAASSLEQLESYASIEKDKHEWSLGLGTSH